MLYVLPIVNPYGISRALWHGIPSGCEFGKNESKGQQHPIGMHRNLRNLNDNKLSGSTTFMKPPVLQIEGWISKYFVFLRGSKRYVRPDLT